MSLVFSNARRVLSQCNARLRLLYLLTKSVNQLIALLHGRGKGGGGHAFEHHKRASLDYVDKAALLAVKQLLNYFGVKNLTRLIFAKLGY